jgi:phenylpyruvate tautomerase PptA (4-oxalocrotonate tautomerase family)
VIQVTLNEGRDADMKSRFYRTLADGLRERVGLRPEDLVVNLVEVKRENWSFGNGKAQTQTPDRLSYFKGEPQ